MNPVREDSEAPKDAFGVVPTRFSTWGPRTVPRVDYERLFVLDSTGSLLGEYVIDDECPLEFADLRRSLPMNGLRHLVSFYQGDYAFTPFKVDDLWFVILTRGVPRIEERGHLGTLLAAARIHIPSSIDPGLARRELELQQRSSGLADREADLAKREERQRLADAQLRVSEMKLRELEADVQTREMKLQSLRDYALQMQQSFARSRGKPSEEKKKKDDSPSAQAELAH